MPAVAVRFANSVGHGDRSFDLVRTLTGTQVNDAGLVQLVGLPKLQSLSLGGTRVTDAGMAQLSQLKNLQVLSLEGTKVSDAGLAHLERLSELQWLGLEDTRVTAVRVRQFKASHADCAVGYSRRWQR